MPAGKIELGTDPGALLSSTDTFVPPDGSYADYWKGTTFNSPNAPGFDRSKPTGYRDQFGEWSIPDLNDAPAPWSPTQLEDALAASRPGSGSGKVEFGTNPGGLVMPAGDPNEITTRGSILPVGVTRGGQVQPAVPEFLVGPLQTVSDILSGKKTVDTLSGKEALDLGRTGGAGTHVPVAATKMSAVAAAGRRLGVDVPRAASNDSVLTRTATKITDAVPFGGSPTRDAAGQALNQLDTAATNAKDALGSGNVPTAGATIQKGITDFAGPKGLLSDNVTAAYGKVDSLVNPNATGDLSQTAAVANQINARRQAAGITQPSQAVSKVLEAVTRPEGLTYSGAKDLRTYIGEILGSPQALASSDVSEAELKQIYGALSTDLTGIVQKAGGQDALAAWHDANVEATKAAQVKTDLRKVLGPDNASEEAVFSRLSAMTGTGARADITTLDQARTAVGDQNWGDVVSAMVNRWGFDQQGKFNPDQFVTQWAKVTPEAKDILFRTPAEKKQLAALNDIATVSQKASQLKAIAEPARPGVITGALGLSGAAALWSHILEPQYVVGPVLGARAISSVLAQPEGAASLATWMRAYVGFATKPNEGTSVVLRKAAAALAYRAAATVGLDAKAQADLATRLANSPADQVNAAKTNAQQIQQGRSEVLSQQTVF